MISPPGPLKPPSPAQDLSSAISIDSLLEESEMLNIALHTLLSAAGVKL